MKIYAALATLALVLIASPSQGGTELTPEGRHIESGRKLVQQSVDGIDLQLIEEDRKLTARTVTRSGRTLRAGPTQPVSVGIIGCPGCQTEALLEGVRPFVFIPLER